MVQHLLYAERNSVCTLIRRARGYVARPRAAASLVQSQVQQLVQHLLYRSNVVPVAQRREFLRCSVLVKAALRTTDPPKGSALNARRTW